MGLRLAAGVRLPEQPERARRHPHRQRVARRRLRRLEGRRRQAPHRPGVLRGDGRGQRAESLRLRHHAGRDHPRYPLPHRTVRARAGGRPRPHPGLRHADLPRTLFIRLGAVASSRSRPRRNPGRCGRVPGYAGRGERRSQAQRLPAASTAGGPQSRRHPGCSRRLSGHAGRAQRRPQEERVSGTAAGPGSRRHPRRRRRLPGHAGRAQRRPQEERLPTAAAGSRPRRHPRRRRRLPGHAGRAQRRPQEERVSPGHRRRRRARL